MSKSKDYQRGSHWISKWFSQEAVFLQTEQVNSAGIRKRNRIPENIFQMSKWGLYSLTTGMIIIIITIKV